MARRFNTVPRPRVLVIGLSEPERAALAELFESVRIARMPGDVALHDFDLLVTDQPGAALFASEVIFVVHVSRERHTWPHRLATATTPVGASMRLDLGQQSRSAEFESPEDVPATVEPLLEQLAADAKAVTMSGGKLRGLEVYSVVEDNQEAAEAFASAHTLPLLIASDGAWVAGVISLPGRPEVWFLPATTRLVEWVTAACEYWSTIAADRFPPAVELGTWWRDARWATVDETEILNQLDDIARRRAEVLAELGAEEQELSERLEGLAAGIDESERRLLTAQGDDLHAAAKNALERLGFRVVDMDEARTEGQQKLEDLRIFDPDDETWVAVAEVRGYTRGAKATDLSGKLRRYREHFIMGEQRPPSATWYVVNHHLATPAEARPTVLQGADDDVSTFADNADGLVIETASLYRLLRGVERGELTAAAARQALRTTVGRFAVE